MADRALFIGFGAPVRGREERAVEVFNEFVDMFERMQSDGRVASMEVSLLDLHGGDLGGFFMVGGSEAQCAALPNDEEFRRACIDAGLIVENFGVVPAVTGDGGRPGNGDVCGGRQEGRDPRARACRNRPQRRLIRFLRPEARRRLGYRRGWSLRGGPLHVRARAVGPTPETRNGGDSKVSLIDG